MKQLRRIREKRTNLLKQLSGMTYKMDVRNYFMELIEENESLYERSDFINFGVTKLSPLEKLK